MKQTTIIQDSKALWLRGNLHCHTTQSDGKLDAARLCTAYSQQGYQYLAITDHDVFTDASQYSTPGFSLLNGLEISGYTTTGAHIHVNAFWTGAAPAITAGERVQLSNYRETSTLLQRLREQGCMLVLNHPHWSHIEYSDVVGMPYFHGVEIYNYATEWFENMGESTIFWERMLRCGAPLWGVAGDDNHNGAPFGTLYCDSFGGFTMVKALKNTAESIFEALKSGSFYCSSGPEIFNFFVEDSTVHISCSPVKRIWINGQSHQYQRMIGDGITEFTAKLKGDEIYIRAECMDSSGRSAYSNPIFL